jgi:hypothetical protein
MKKNPVLFLILIAIVVINTKCAKTLQVNTLPQKGSEGARIYIFRPSIGAYSVPINIYEDDKIIGRLGTRAYLVWETTSDVMLLKAEGGISADRLQDILKIIPQPGNSYYFKLKPKVISPRLFDYTIVKIQQQEASKYLAQFKAPNIKIIY